jgi:hypothetical protein
MLADEIEVGEVYMAHVAGYYVPVRVDVAEENWRTEELEWVCTNQMTDRTITIRRAARFKRRAEDSEIIDHEVTYEKRYGQINHYDALQEEFEAVEPEERDGDLGDGVDP